ncbi:dynamin family protein [Virgibacillus doumboii]|uniref:dynamin family protein n=1 Tax=Virgibacillus doumboii TaxID=2697503 RepID=UPI0013DF66D3|nr:dynamin family protein [Virgibacillus doumboii]
MISTKINQAEIKLQHLAGLYQAMTENNDNKNANKVLDVFEKLNKQEFVISFAGHFSAGKSSMINSLLGRSILPKSPIPTSANVVKIKSGNGNARVYFHDDAPVEYQEPYDIDMIKEFAKDKASIKEIEINTSETILPDDCVLIDTPGIDAADDTDRLITESSLHLVDALFYVMDYNHVQSDVNLQFLKKIQDYEIPYYLIINQIDKHEESEITFKMFNENIKQTFDQWGISPEMFFYSSLVKASSPHNQFPEIKDKLFSLMYSKNDSFSGAARSVNQIIKEHQQFLRDLYEEKLAEVSMDDSDTNNNTYARIEEIDEKITDLKAKPDRLEEEFYNDLNTTLKNAYLMPAELRDKAELFLESQQSDFKVGLFAAKKKTEEERNVRLESFLEHLLKNVETSIQWKLRDKFSNLLKRYSIYDQTLLQWVQEISIDYNAEALLSLVKSGAKINGESILNYTKDVSSEIKKRYKMEARKLWDTIYVSFNNALSDELTKFENERNQLSFMYEKQLRKEELEQELHDKLQIPDNVFADPKPDEYVWEQIYKAIEAKTGSIKQADESCRNEKTVKTETVNESQPSNERSNISAENILSNIEKTIQTIDDLPGFQSIVDDLTRKKDRLQNRKYTIALFGAFSAGKSSFANALIGKKLLPVSPNPTTAVINRINPITEEYKHGTVVVKLKAEQTLVEDVRFLTKNFSPTAERLDELIGWIRESNIHNSEQLHKTHQSYLKAVITGYQQSKDKLAQEIFITLDDFADYVTDETKACYIESIDLYYESSLTKEGITLVDTPGADSVNARHTNVAFDYIKHADAILYVTYYNHALSRADKDFLLQLGRVKDAFQLDKMFFIMNAADLAENNEELNMVINYVESELTRLGIRFPRLFPVSSKQSLKDKLNNKTVNQQMKTFEDSFKSFIHDELAAITIHSAIRDIDRASQMVNNFIDSSRLSAQEKEQFIEDMHTEQAVLKRLTDKLDNEIYAQKITQKIEKQLYYVLERLSIRFHDMFKETFNPATITETGKKAKLQLENSLRNLLDYTGYELMQELRAVSLRIEALINELRNDVHHDYSKLIGQTDTKFTLPDLTEAEIETPAYSQAFENLEPQAFHKELKGFNGTKAFFAKNEKEIMKENIFNRLSPFAEEYINDNHQKMKESYIDQWNAVMSDVKLEINQNIDKYITNHLSMVTDQSIDIDTLKDKHHELKMLLADHELNGGDTYGEQR